MNDIPTYIWGALLGVTAIQVAPIRIDPWTWLFKWIGKTINQEVMKEIESVKKQVDMLEAKADKTEAESARNRIVRFSDEILHGVKHSKEHFDQLLIACDVYEKYCDEHKNFENNVASQSIKLIKDTYGQCMREKSFL